MKAVVILSLCALPVIGLAESPSVVEDREGPPYTEEEVAQAFRALSVKRLETLKGSPEELSDFVNSQIAARRVEERAKAEGLLEDLEIKEKMRQVQTRFLLTTLKNEAQKRELKHLEPFILDWARTQYEAFKDRYYQRSKIRIAEIIIHKNPCNAEESHQKALAMMEELARGVGFEDLAAKYSDAENAKSGGVIRKWFYGPHLNFAGESEPFPDRLPEIMKAAFALKKAGEVSSLLDLPNGYGLVKLMQISPMQLVSFEQVKEGLLKQAKGDYIAQWEIDYMRSFYPSQEANINNGRIKQILGGVMVERQALGVKPTQAN